MTKKIAIYKYSFAGLLILLGLILNLFKIGTSEFAGFQTIGSWIIFAGILVAFLTFVMSKTRKGKILDERAEKIGYKTLQLSNAILFLSLFALMIVDGIHQITTRYYMFLSWIICYYVVLQAVIYKIIERKN